MTVEKEKALELAISQIKKRYGDGSIMKLGDHTLKLAVEVIPTVAGAGYCFRSGWYSQRAGN